MKSLPERLRNVELAMHMIWNEHCAGAACKEVHKPIWNELQQVLLTAANECERRSRG